MRRYSTIKSITNYDKNVEICFYCWLSLNHISFIQSVDISEFSDVSKPVAKGKIRRRTKF